MSDAREPARTVGLRQVSNRGKSFKLIPFGDVLVSVKPRYLIKGILPEVGIGIMYGDKKSYKSFIALDMMMHIALGRNYRSHRVRQGPVIYLVLEGRDGFDKRIEAARKHFDLDGSDVPLFLIKDRVQLDDDCVALIRDLKTKLEGPPPVAIVIDTLKRVLSGSENDDAAMGALLDAAQAISDEMKCFTMLVHHTGHGGGTPARAQQPRRCRGCSDQGGKKGKRQSICDDRAGQGPARRRVLAQRRARDQPHAGR